MKFLTHPLTEDRAKSILEALPPSRRNTYISIAQNHEKSTNTISLLAAYLYVWNGYIASSVDRTTGEVEVLLRNFIDEKFSAWNNLQAESESFGWILHPRDELYEIVFPKNGKPLVKYADTHSVNGSPTHDDYVAGLPFGSWVHLLPKKHAKEKNARVILWEQALAPHLNVADRKAFQDAAMKVKDMRNRATHRRPLIKNLNELRETHRRCVEIARAINPNIGEWILEEKWIPQALREDPRIER
ncbi:hypothetical protein EML15_04390 [Corynebacterium sp. sy017]|uniref:hypothetical protein n=1 Tax=unclassified Corynebacterium TaxID=2624378 RepID=UPI0011871447|nr:MULTISPECIES: hypothetical protein [unclassified Corynebacterium]MBP3088386.1 hypothetical protein [Corynebacterium sp. sy017]TSD91701.1 hypothetical protein ELY17_04390 [Corynebacterium sp. SY003]